MFIIVITTYFYDIDSKNKLRIVWQTLDFVDQILWETIERNGFTFCKGILKTQKILKLIDSY